MGKITVLDEQLSNMIAAGEVVERPASVVKELVENAIDAKATRIEVHVEEGGLQLIRVVDNGEGMDREDCRKAFERHATSKIRSARDLFRIHTLGFRGEALPSIASVARVELISTEDSGRVGTRLLVEGGQVKEVADAARVKGTELIVRDLFFNTPARLKYLKSISTEIGHISDYLNRLALTNPAVSFHLSHNGKTLLQTSGDGKLLHVIAAIYGVQVAKQMIPISGETLDFKWNGFLSNMQVTRANRSYLTTLVNGRYIRSIPLNNAIMRGYHTLLPIGRYPLVVLQIEMDPTLVDVNVHPAKLEVRFSKEDELCQAIERSVQAALRQGLQIVQPWQQESRRKAAATSPVQTQLDFAGQPKPLSPEASARTREWLRPPSLPERNVSEPPAITPANELLTAQPKATVPSQTVREAKQIYHPVDIQEPIQPPAKNPDWQEAAAAQPPLEEAFLTELPAADAGVTERGANAAAVPPLYPVGQVHGTYIVAQNETGMYLVDQHAAQERIYYEYFMEKLATDTAASQFLLFPHTVECTVEEAERLQNRLEWLRSFGLEIEWFGNRTFIVRAHPHWFPQGSELEVIEELIQFVLETSEGQRADIRLMREKAAILMSCKAAIKANKYLTMAEMEALLNRLRETTSPFTCPHGRPIIIHFSSYDLEKMFKRVM